MKLPIIQTLCDYNDAYNLVRGDINVVAAPAKQETIKNWAPFTNCITKIDETTDDGGDLDLVMPMYNLIEYRSNYSGKTGSLWFYSKDETTNFNANIANTDNFKSFKYKAKLLGNTEAHDDNAANGVLKNATIALPLKYLSNFWRSLEMPLINCKGELRLRWTKHCVLSAAGTDNANGNNDDNDIIFIISDKKLYVPVVTLSARDNQRLSKLLGKAFERSVYWNESKTKSGNKNTTNEYRYFLESNFVGINRLFVLVYTNEAINAKRFNAWKYYLPKDIIKNYNAIINGKNFYGQPIDSDIKRYEEIRKLATRKGEDYTPGCLLDYDYIKHHYKLIAVDWSRQKRIRCWSKSNSTNRICWTIKKTRWWWCYRWR